jgi:hypothetical protein
MMYGEDEYLNDEIGEYDTRISKSRPACNFYGGCDRSYKCNITDIFSKWNMNVKRWLE